MCCGGVTMEYSLWVLSDNRCSDKVIIVRGATCVLLCVV